MKKIIIFTLLALSTFITCNGQNVYSKLEQFNKFNELVAKQDIKTLITETDSVLTIEIQGHKPLIYNIVYRKWLGTADKPINLTYDVWGYEIQYFTMEEKIIVIRTITNMFGDFIDKVAWLELNNGDRLIYSLK